MDITEIKRLLPWSVKQRPEVQAVLVKAEQAEQGWATASSACNRVADERDRLKAELTTAKEEIERLFQDTVQTQRHADSLLEKLHAAESSLESERKETERWKALALEAPVYFSAHEFEGRRKRWSEKLAAIQAS
jgi:septal ring factor EnvC (AmiA/AmiB activator)